MDDLRDRLSSEFDLAKLGDARLNKRLRRVMPRLAARPADGFPQTLVRPAEIEGFYRLLSNDGVRYRALVEGHARRTLERIAPATTVRVIHDTTTLTYSTSREGLGRTLGPNSALGYQAHTSLAVTSDEHPQPLGVLGLFCWARTQPPRGNRKMHAAQLSRISDKESDRWGNQIAEVEALVDEHAELIHIADREADAYPLLAHLVESEFRFVIRLAQNRAAFGVDDDGEHDQSASIAELANQLPVRVERHVRVTGRTAQFFQRKLKKKDGREERLARMEVRSGRVALRRPQYRTSKLPETVEMNIVWVAETDAPEGVEPVSWVLATSEPVNTRAEVEAVIDHYRARWTIEEFFKALKTGCSIEKRQLESFETLTNALALFLPIACQMLALRSLERSVPDAPADAVLDPLQIAVLQHFQPEKMPKKNATVRHALYAVAGMGGHIKNNGAPGWLTLARGMETLTLSCQAWAAATAAAKRPS